MLPEPFEPNYEAIEQSQIWQDQIAPMLDQMYGLALDSLVGLNSAPLVPDGPKFTLEDCTYWRAFAAAIKAVRDTPGMRAEQKRRDRKQRNEDETLQQNQSRLAEYRRSNA